jgi:two-component system sensor histidine kinase KdpD
VALAIGAPVVVGVVLVPFRDELAQSVSLVMVLPVVLVAVVAGLWTALLAAVTAACVFNVLHTEPYGTLRIDDADDVVEMIVLLAVGAAIGVVVQAAQRAVVSARVRHRELDALTEFLDTVGRNDRDALIESGRHAIASVLDARQATWRPGYRGTAAPVLGAGGALVSRSGGGSAGATLPAQIEIPVGTPPHEHGRFVLASSDADVSAEERTAAAAIAAALGRLLDAAPRSDR